MKQNGNYKAITTPHSDAERVILALAVPFYHYARYHWTRNNQVIIDAPP